MKKIVIILSFLLLSISLYAQKNVIDTVSKLPIPQEAVETEHEYLTSLTREQVINYYYKTYGIELIYDDGFYMSYFKNNSDSCIFVSIKNKGKYLILSFSLECG